MKNVFKLYKFGQSCAKSSLANWTERNTHSSQNSTTYTTRADSTNVPRHQRQRNNADMAPVETAGWVGMWVPLVGTGLKRGWGVARRLVQTGEEGLGTTELEGVVSTAGDLGPNRSRLNRGLGDNRSRLSTAVSRNRNSHGNGNGGRALVLLGNNRQ